MRWTQEETEGQAEGWKQGQGLREPTPAHPPRSSHGRNHTAQADLGLALERRQQGGHFSPPQPLRH